MRFAEPSVNQYSVLRAHRDQLGVELLAVRAEPAHLDRRRRTRPASSAATERFGMPFFSRPNASLLGSRITRTATPRFAAREQRLDHARAPIDRTSRRRCCRRRARRRSCARSRQRISPSVSTCTRAVFSGAGRAGSARGVGGGSHSPCQPNSRASASSLSSSGMQRRSRHAAARRSNAGCSRRADSRRSRCR